jgi:hypothetical protein
MMPVPETPLVRKALLWETSEKFLLLAILIKKLVPAHSPNLPLSAEWQLLDGALLPAL